MSRRIHRHAFLAIGVALATAGFSSPLTADEPPPATSDAAATESPSIDELARRLDSDSFDDRQNAAEALAGRGAEAIPALERVAEEGSREAKSRALDLLIAPLGANDGDAAKTAARAALERLAKSPDAYASRRAAEALKPAEPAAAPQQAAVPRMQFPPGFPQGVPNIRIQAMAQNANLKIERRNENGQETTKVQDGDRTVEISKDPTGRIEMTVKEKAGDKETVEKFAGKDEADLKANSPKAHELYKKYAGQGPGMQIVVGNGVPAAFPAPGFQRALPPGFPPGFPQNAVPANDAQSLERRIQMMRQMLENIQKHETRISEQIEALEEELKDAREKEAEKAPAEKAPAEEDREAGSDAEGGSDD